MPYYDLEHNFPLIFDSLRRTYYEGLESYRIPTSVTWTRRKSRTSIQRTAKKQSALRKQHSLENSLDKSLPDKDKTLVIRFVGARGIGYMAKTNAGVFAVLDLFGVWIGGFFDSSEEQILFQVSDKSYTDCLARLCGQTWAYHKFSARELSLYDIYQDVYFDFSDSKRKKPRNNTLKLRVNSVLKAVWL